MSNTKPQFDMGYVIIALVCAGIFGLIYIVSLFQEQEDPQALLIAQQKWVQNDLLLNSLQRYTDVYQQLKNPEDKKILAKIYVKKITRYLLMFPAKDGSTIRVVLPEQSENNKTVMVLKEIKLGTTDNGLFKAFQEVLDPPSISRKQVLSL